MLFVLLVLLLGACSTSQSIQKIDRPVTEVQKIAERNSAGGLANVSPNGRVFKSKFFTDKKGVWETYRGEKIRYYSIIKVLGDRRPYVVEAQVFAQSKLSDKTYSRPKYSEPLSRVLIRRIEKSIYDTGLNRNIIDDFKVF